MSYRCHGLIFRATRASAIVAFDEQVDQHLCPELIQIQDDVFGVRTSQAIVSDSTDRLETVAKELSRTFSAAFTVWYESIWSAFKFSVFAHGSLHAKLRTDGEGDDQWLDVNGEAFAFGPPQLLSSNGSLLTKTLKTLPGPRDPARDCDLAVAASVLGVELQGFDYEDLFRWDSVFPAIRQKRP